MNIDLTFPASYRVELVPEFPGYAVSNLFYFPTGRAGGTEGVLLRVTPERGNVWLGCFPPYTSTPVLIAAPQQDWLFVICSGEGYAVNTHEPSEGSCISCQPVTGIQIVREHGMILFADSLSITAYGRGGITWKSGRLCWDDLKIIELDGSQIIGCGYDAPTGSEGRFVLDLFTGAVRESDFPIFD